MRVAFTTFAILKKPYGNPEVQGFDDRTPNVFDEAEGSEGFIARAKELSGSELANFNRDWGDWGKFDVPCFYNFGRTDETDQRASTLSLWRDLSSVYRFVYSGLHLEALKKRREWFLKPEWPTYAVWWVDEDYVPQWKDACEKLEQLHFEGATASSFDFKHPFDESDQSIELGLLR